VEILDKDGNAIPQQESETVEEILNSMKAIWAKSKGDVTDEEYNEFYTHLTHDPEPPLARIHFKMEGVTEYDALLYIPSKQPFDLFFKERKHGVDLYCRRVFIMENCAELMPEYLRFVKGVADSSDLDLNVSREMLQQNRLVTNMKKNLVKKVLDTLEEMDAETYDTFFEEFGPVLKEGVPMDWDNREKLSELLRFKTTKSEGKLVSLKEYVENMQPDQKEIFYLTGEKISTLINSPALEGLKARDYEVLLMTDVVDEFVVQSLPEYKDKKLRSAEKGDLEFGETDEKKNKEFEGLLKRIQTVLADSIKEVKPSSRLKDSVVCMSGEMNDMSAYMEKFLKATGQELPASQRIMEVNLKHPVLEKLLVLFQDNDNNPVIDEYARFLLDLAVIGEGGKIEDPGSFGRFAGEIMADALFRKAAGGS
jgi:molecular chaperone HtpG